MSDRVEVPAESEAVDFLHLLRAITNPSDTPALYVISVFGRERHDGVGARETHR